MPNRVPSSSIGRPEIPSRPHLGGGLVPSRASSSTASILAPLVLRERDERRLARTSQGRERWVAAETTRSANRCRRPPLARVAAGRRGRHARPRRCCRPDSPNGETSFWRPSIVFARYMPTRCACCLVEPGHGPPLPCGGGGGGGG